MGFYVGFELKVDKCAEIPERELFANSETGGGETRLWAA